MLKKYLRNICISLDQLINTILGGDPDETVSSRLGKNYDGSWMEKTINWLFRKTSDNHCSGAEEKDEGVDAIYVKYMHGNKGKKQSLEHLRKRALAISKAKLGSKYSVEHRKHISESNKGKHFRKMTDIQIEANRIRTKKLWDNPEFRKKCSEAQKGEKSHLWKGGKVRSRFIDRRIRIKRKKGNGGSHNFGEWENLKAQYNWTCPYCGKREPNIKLTEDHIIPLAKGGTDNIENIQPLCRKCNCIKATRIVSFEF